jgi:hypothetical protein
MLLLITGALFIFNMLRSLSYTHSIAGPVHKTIKVLKNATAGGYSDHPITFRKNDYFNDLAREINNCITKLRTNDERREELQSRLISAVSDLNKDESVKDELKTKFNSILEEFNREDTEQ